MDFSTSSESPINPIKITFEDGGEKISIGNTTSLNTFYIKSNNTKHYEHDSIKVIGYGQNKSENVFIIKNDDGHVIHEINDDGKHKVIDINTDGDHDKKVWVSKNNNTTIEVISSVDSNNPLIIIDGKESTQNIEDLDPENIQSISVLKDASVNKYGDKGKNGVILITTKKE